MDLTEQSPIILSLCPGIRGIERGLERIFRSVRVAAYVEVEAFIVENLLTAMEAGLVDAAPIWSNLKTFNPDPFRDRIDGIIGGYPCQPFSLAGNRNGVQDPRHLWPFIYSIVKQSRPTWCFFENVRGHLSMGYPEVYRNLRDLGYRVEPGIYSAEEVGAPHQRDRLFILAIMEDTTFFRERGGSVGNTQRNECKNQAQGSVGALGNSTCLRPRRDNKGRFQSQIIRTDSEFSDPDFQSLEIGSLQPEPKKCSTAQRGSSEKLADTNNQQGRLSEPEEWRKGPEAERSSNELANTGYDGQNGSKDGQGTDQRESGNSTGSRKFFKSSGLRNQRLYDRFPAGQGEHQYDWEESRTIESSLVYTVNGYNFTEDLHRAIGNSVVEQTAEIAFRDLLNKHFSKQ
ncbi:DNA cytosine methyltransferase [Dyadobacter helix]|uniref:DNA cytosine methyltransferase n=1 Tax=Dyadobacter helix TaxID=2822344 RepID=UPI001BFC31C9|nr:DNA cytosine methyltransferase [Dyadobacter sp. CECT 9275]